MKTKESRKTKKVTENQPVCV